MYNIQLKLKKNNDDDYNCHFLGEINISFEDLCFVFGEPQRIYDRKSQCLLKMKINNIPFEIYDWKNEDGVEDIYNWHVGGDNDMLMSILKTYIYLKLKEKEVKNEHKRD